jgi:hypothetical protein
MKKGFLATAILLGVSFTASANEPVRMVAEGVPESMLEESTAVESYRQSGGRWVLSVVPEFSEEYFNTLKSMGYDVEKSARFTREKVPAVSSYQGSVKSYGDSYSDPELSRQDSLRSSNNDLLLGMTAQRGQDEDIKILVLDTGHIPHEDIEVSGGHSYTTQFGASSSPNYEDKTIMPDGTECRSGHGTAMSGVIAATQNNGIGMAGIAEAQIYAGRVMATDCSTGEDVGDLVDLYDALVDIHDSQGNGFIPTPDVINVSLAANAVCPGFLQEAIDDVVGMGVVVVAAAGNQSSITASYAPANCAGVTVVSAHDEDGRLSSYSNSGQQVDVGMAGTHLVPVNGTNYEMQSGTSGAAAAVSGMYGVLKRNFPNSTPDELTKVVRDSAKPYSDTGCQTGCGTGMANLDRAINLAEKVLDPKLTTEHGMSGLEKSCQVGALSNHMEVCNTALIDVKTSFAVSEPPVEYRFRTMRRDKSATSWEHHTTEFIGDFEQLTDHEKIPLTDLDFDTFDYGVAKCDEDKCSFVFDVDESDIERPAYCL